MEADDIDVDSVVVEIEETFEVVEGFVVDVADCEEKTGVVVLISSVMVNETFKRDVLGGIHGPSPAVQ